MWENQKLLPVEERGAFISIVLGLFLLFAGIAVLYYGNIFIGYITQRLERRNFGPMLFGATFSLLVHGLQVLFLYLAWISIGQGISSYFGRFELLIKLLVSSVGIWMTYLVLPTWSLLLEYSIPINFYMSLLLVILFQALTQQVDNFVDKSAAMMLWVYSFQSLELLPTYLPNGQATSALFTGMFRTNEDVAIASMAGTSLFLSFMAGAVISTWVLASYSIRLSQVRKSWAEDPGEAIEDEDEGLRKVSMVDMRSLVHDLKTPLAAIKGTAFMLQGSKNSDNGALEKVSIMLNATNYMERMIGEILHEDLLHEIRVDAFFNRVERYVRPFPWGGDVTVSMAPEVEQEAVAVNEIRFTRALMNLLDNAGRANRTAGAKGIELRIRRNAKFLEIEVLDNGPGLGGKVGKQKSGWGSTGLGLAFARKVTASHGGNLLLTQRIDAPHGTSALISLPLKT